MSTASDDAEAQDRLPIDSGEGVTNHPASSGVPFEVALLAVGSARGIGNKVLRNLVARLGDDLGAVWSLSPDVLARLPTRVVTSIFGGLLRNIDVDVVDVPGITRPAYLGGSRVKSMWAFAPPTGAAQSVTLLSHGTKCCVGVLSDTKAVVDTGLMHACFEHAFDEVLALDPKAQSSGVM